MFLRCLANSDKKKNNENTRAPQSKTGIVIKMKEKRKERNINNKNTRAPQNKTGILVQIKEKEKKKNLRRIHEHRKTRLKANKKKKSTKLRHWTKYQIKPDLTLKITCHLLTISNIHSDISTHTHTHIQLHLHTHTETPTPTLTHR